MATGPTSLQRPQFMVHFEDDTWLVVAGGQGTAGDALAAVGAASAAAMHVGLAGSGAAAVAIGEKIEVLL